jgi:hypothetical protein
MPDPEKPKPQPAPEERDAYAEAGTKGADYGSAEQADAEGAEAGGE